MRTEDRLRQVFDNQDQQDTFGELFYVYTHLVLLPLNLITYSIIAILAKNDSMIFIMILLSIIALCAQGI